METRDPRSREYDPTRDGFPIAQEPADARRFPDCPRFIPWDAIQPHEAQAKNNHGRQSLRELARRGGLDPTELYCVFHGKPWGYGRNVDYAAAVEFVKTLTTPEKEP